MKQGISANKKDISPSDYSMKPNSSFSPVDENNKFK